MHPYRETWSEDATRSSRRIWLFALAMLAVNVLLALAMLWQSLEIQSAALERERVFDSQDKRIGDLEKQLEDGKRHELPPHYDSRPVQRCRCIANDPLCDEVPGVTCIK